ncbi:lysine--tRNA ligase [Bosea sp. (in: a-proteobacteria)]|uniref:lysine--tRNA ligase n=1 Tax=Bosea sp. (in: a-proteobacteria) TaxID=1871050 RepID=UPI002FC6AFC8
MSAFEPALIEAARVSAAWPFEEAKKLVARLQKSGKQEAVFETGYGPSGLPHIGTFGEVARTSMVRHAFQVLTDGAIPTRLIAFSDDLDGLRKVPDNVPNKELLARHLGQPLTEVPDPFGTHDSFGRHNNARLCAFLDQFGFDYEFKSSTDAYRAGEFDATLLKTLARFDQVMKIMLATLREERAATYSPFLPIHPKTRIVMQVPIEASDVAAGTITWSDPDTGERFTTPVTGGHAKLQWKPDWAMRWVALGVDYEMAGKDLIDSVKVSSQIARALDGTPPEGFNYELFLDEQGQKISKSKGNGLTIEEWLDYGSPESLALFMYSRPREAKKLHFDVIPRAVDEYLQFLGGYERQDWKNRLGNPAWHIHAGNPPAPELVAQGGTGENANRAQITFGLLLNLVAVANSEDKAVLWAFLQRYAPDVSAQTHPRLDALVGYAIAYFRDFVKPAKHYRLADETEREAFTALADALAALPADASAETVQDAALDIARAVPRYQNFQAKSATPERPAVTGEWWKAIYQVLFGEEQGPRFGSFAAIYGLENTRKLIAKALAGELLSEHEGFVAARKASA